MTLPRATAGDWGGLALLSLPTMLLGLDVTVLYLVLPSLAQDLAPTASQSLWIMDAYGLFIAAFLVFMGTVGDWIGRRRLLLIGMAAFAAISVLAAFAPNAEWLIVARALLGVAGAALMPSTLSLIAIMFGDPRQRALAIGVWATMFSFGMAAGPIVGGALVESLWWGAAFLLAVPIATIVLGGAHRLLPEYAASRPGRLDLLGAGLLLAALLPIVFAIKHTASSALDGLGIAAFGLGIIAAVLFVRRQNNAADPLLDLSLFSRPSFSAALVVLLIGLIGVGGTMYLVTRHLQLVAGFPPLHAGLWMGPPALAMFGAAIGAPLLARRIRPGIVMGATLCLSVMGYGILALARAEQPMVVVAGFGLVYLGLGAMAALGTELVIATAPGERSGSAAALSETAQELGVAIGVAVLGSLSAAIAARGMGPGGAEELADTLARADELSPEAVETAREAFMNGFQVASITAGLAVMGAVILCFTLLRGAPALGSPARTVNDGAS